MRIRRPTAQQLCKSTAECRPWFLYLECKASLLAEFRFVSNVDVPKIPLSASHTQMQVPEGLLGEMNASRAETGKTLSEFKYPIVLENDEEALKNDGNI